MNVNVIAATIATVLAGSAAGPIATAQESDASLEEIVVTGTRIRRDDYSEPNLISTFDSEQMRNLGVVNVSDIMTQIPSNVSRFQAENTGGSAFFVGSTLPNLRGLNPFFGTRTLTLVDSRRHVPTNQGGSVDLNFIPSVLVDRMETVTGGASASYGSQAISGVVNVLLDQDFEGVRLELDTGATSESDGDSSHVGIAGGTDLFDSRAHIVVGAEMQTQDAIEDCATARDWCARSTGIFSNASGGGPFDPLPNPRPYEDPVLPGQPQNLITSDLRYPGSVNGTIFDGTESNSITRYQFNDAGNDVVTYDQGMYAYNDPTESVVGGEGRSIYSGQALMPEVERETAYAHFNYEVSDTLNFFVEASYGKVDAVNLQYPPTQTSRVVCVDPTTNAYVQRGSSQMQSVLASLVGQAPPQNCPPTEAAIVKDFVNQVDHKVTTATEVQRFVLGFDGTFGTDENWVWDAYYQYGETKRDQIGHDYQTNHRFTMALDTMINPATGQPDCRVNVLGVIPFDTLPIGADPSLAEGCVPANPFGSDTLSEEAKDYVYGDLTEFNDIEQHVAAVNFSGEIWQGWGAGPLLMAGGLELRNEELHNDAGDLPFYERTDFNLQYGDEFGGETDVSEAYVEFEMPFLRDVPGAELWMMNVAFRSATYENQGLENTTMENISRDIDSWKVSMVWDPIDVLRVRATRSEDIRAGGFRELYYSQTIPAGGFFGSVTNPWLPEGGSPFAQSDDAQLILSGNPRLSPEVAHTTTYGFVITPGGAAEGLQLSADYYEIELRDGIRGGITPEVVSGCFNGDQTQCGYITFGPPSPLDPTDPRSNITSVRAPYVNDEPYDANGIDLSASYLLGLDNGNDISLRLLATHAIDTLISVDGEQRDIAGQVGGNQGFLEDYAPSSDWSGNLIVSYLADRFNITAQAQYTSDGKLNKQTPYIGPSDPGFDPGLTTTVDDNTVPSHVTWNLSGAYRLDVARMEQLELFATINNVFDEDPPFAAGATGGANPLFHDALGRQYRVGLRMQF